MDNSADRRRRRQGAKEAGASDRVEDSVRFQLAKALRRKQATSRPEVARCRWRFLDLILELGALGRFNHGAYRLRCAPFPITIGITLHVTLSLQSILLNCR